MKLNNLKPAAGSTHSRRRIGRGPGSGHGKTAGKGHKGQNARSGGGVRPGFEGGQLPLFRRLGKRGFSNARFKTVYACVNVSDLNKFDDNTTVTPELLIESGLVKKELNGIQLIKEYTPAIHTERHYLIPENDAPTIILVKSSTKDPFLGEVKHVSLMVKTGEKYQKIASDA